MLTFKNGFCAFPIRTFCSSIFNRSSSQWSDTPPGVSLSTPKQHSFHGTLMIYEVEEMFYLDDVARVENVCSNLAIIRV